MGSGQSRNLDYASYSSSNILKDSDENVFEVNFDDLFFTSEFHSDLLDLPEDKRKINVSPPNENIVADIMTDPTAFASVQSTEEAWLEVLAPLFTGNERTKPFINQLYSVMFRFFNERPNKFFEIEENRQLGVMENINTEKPLINRHYNQYESPKISINNELINSINNIQSIVNNPKFKSITSIPDFNKISLISANPAYTSISEKLKEILNGFFVGDDCSSKKSDIEHIIMYIINWGLFSSDISCIIDGLISIFKYLLSTNPQPKFTFPVQHYSEILLNSISLTNSINFLPPNPRSVLIPKYSLPKNPSCSLIACDGKRIYIIGNHGLLHSISLNKGIVNNTTRFHTIQLNMIPKKERVMMGITISNSYAYINGPFIPKPYIFKLPSFEQVKEGLTITSDSKGIRKNKIKPPFTSDGQFIYTLNPNKQKISVYVIQPPKIKLQRTLSIKLDDKDSQTMNSNHSSSMLSADSDKIPQIPKNKNIPIFTNGTVLTIVLLTKETNGHFYYTMRHFSLIDGTHIGDNLHIQKWPLFSILYDPWNRVYWELSPEKEKSYLIKLPNFTAQPLWLNGWLTNVTTQNYYEILNSISSSKNMKSFYISMSSYLNFLSAQFNGCSFRAITSSHLTTTHFICPCTPELIKSIISAVQYLAELLDKCNKNSKYIKKVESVADLNFIRTTIFAYMGILNYNLTNFEARVVKEQTIQLNQKDINGIVDFLYAILQDDSLSFIHRSVAFVFSNSFSLLMKEPNEKITNIFKKLYLTMPHNIVSSMLSKIDNNQMFPYLFSSRIVREIFHPVLKDIAMSNHVPNEIEIISSFMRSMMLELKKVYTNNQIDIPPSAQMLSDTFIAFANLMSEETDFFLKRMITMYHEETFKFHPFVRLLSKWLIMLEPFTQFNRLSTKFTAFLNVFLNFYSQNLDQIKANPNLRPNGKGYSAIYMIYYEIFSEYLDFLSALLNGGTELKEATQYLWLIKSTIDGHVTPSDIDSLVEKTKIKEDNKPKKQLLSKGFSFNINQKDSMKKELVVDFVSNLTLRKESPSAKSLMDFLYKKVNNPLNKRLNDEQRWIERLILGAFSKQLGVASILFNLATQSTKEETPVLSPFIKQILESIYKIRRNLALSRQKTNQFRARCEQDMTPPITDKLEENYEEFMNQIIKKAVFLLHIQPCLQFQSDKFEEDFPLMLKNLTFFTTSTITVENYFKLITASNNSRKNLTTGIQLIIDFLKTNKNAYCNSFLIDKFSSSGDIVNYLSTLEASSRKQGIQLIVQLMEILRQFIVNNNNSETPSNAMIVLYANLILSIAKISKEDVFGPLSNLLEELTKKHSGDVFRSYLSFLGSVMTILYETIPEFANSPEFLSLIKRLFPSKEITENMLPIARICYKAGLDLQIDYTSIMDILKNCNPSYYHSVSTFLGEVLSKTIDKIKFLSIVMKEIGLSISGTNSLIMNDFPNFDEKINNNNANVDKCKSVNAICSCISELIQFCRRILISGDENGSLLMKIFNFVLNYYSPETNNNNSDDFSSLDKEIMQMFQDKIYCYSIFAILSNSIDGIHVNSILKNEEDNTIYYIDSIDQVNQQYFVWKLPITKNSEVISISFSQKYIPVSIMPFTTSMYSNYNLLIPFFVKALSESRANSLDILVLMAFKEYSSDSNFLTEFMPVFQKEFLSESSSIKLKNFSFIDTSNFFQILLYSHLRQNSNGFNEIVDQFPQFYVFSPYDYSVSAEITSNSINCGEDIHMFITTPVSMKMKSTLIANVSKCTNFQIGLYCLSTYESGADYILLSCVNGRFMTDSRFYSKFNDKQYNGEKIVVNYVPQKGASIFIDDKRVNVDLMKMDENPISFLIVTYETATIDYSIQTEFTMVSSSDSSSFSPSFAPFAGQAVFVRKKENRFDLFNKKQKKDYDLDDIKSILKKNTRSLINNDINVDFNSFKTQQNLMIEEQIQSVGQKEQDDIIIYPDQVYSQLSEKINVTPNSDLCRNQPNSEFLYSTIRQENSIDIRYFESDKNGIILHAFIPEGDDRVVYTNKNKSMKFINKFSGIIQESDKATTVPNSLPLITLLHYSILPPKIINHFATSYLKLIRNESISSYLMKCIATTSQIEDILQLLLKVELNNDSKTVISVLVQIVIRLFVLLEPINVKVGMQAQCPIDFDADVLQMPPRLPNLHLYLSALQKILDYVKSDNERLNQFTNEWFNVLKNQFHDGFSHSVQPNHPHAIIRTFSNKTSSEKNVFCCTKPYSIIRENVKWIIVRVGFVNPTTNISVFKKTNQYNYNSNDNNNDEQNILLNCQNSLQFEFHREKGTFAAIPYINNNNDNLSGTFFDLVISMKYFSIFVNKNMESIKSLKIYRTNLHSFFFESLIARSPFFVKYNSSIFHFLNEKLVICGSDIAGSYARAINLLAIYYGKEPVIASYLSEQETLYNEQSLIGLKTFYPQFQSPSDILQIKEFMDEMRSIHGDDFRVKFEVPLNFISNLYSSYDRESVMMKTVNNLRRIFKANQEKKLSGYPFHFLLEDWTLACQMVPPFEVSTVLPSIIKVHFTTFTPTECYLRLNWLGKHECIEFLSFAYSIDERVNYNWNPFNLKYGSSQQTDVFKPPAQTFYLKICLSNLNYSSFQQWSNVSFIIMCQGTKQDFMNRADLFACQHSKEFANDIRSLALQWEPNNTQTFLDCLEYSQIQNDTLNINRLLYENVDKFMTKKAITIVNESIPLHCRLIQGKLLIILNWLISNHYIDLKQMQNKVFMPHIWKQLKIIELKKKISQNSEGEYSANLSIDRKAAGDIRLGISTNLRNTITNQMAEIYRPVNDFRVQSDRPWTVKFANEDGIDVGGPARELVAECAEDFCCPLCGLVVPTPNSRNDVGDYKDCVIPIANPGHLMIQKQYETAGAMMAIAARTELVQTYNFPPLVWEYLVTGEIPSISMIFDIDEVYKTSITSLMEAMKSEMTEDEFASRFKMKFVVIDSTGKEVPLTQRGKTESVTMSNCGLYISLANNFRLNEMKNNLEAMRKGLWENFNFDPTPSLDASTLEFACCGQKEITLEILMKVTEFRDISEDRQAMFWRVVEEFTPAERSLLLKFSTARVNLPPQITDSTTLLIIDDANLLNRCPTASTCFHKLHLPDYSSFENAYRLIKMAIECTGTFELS